MSKAADFGRVHSEQEVDQLLHPSRFYAHPAEVVADDLLTFEERRAILSLWASDACAVDSNPPLRQASFARAPATFDDVMDALQRLDRLEVCRRRAQRADVLSRNAGAYQG